MSGDDAEGDDVAEGCDDAQSYDVVRRRNHQCCI